MSKMLKDQHVKIGPTDFFVRLVELLLFTHHT